MEGKLTQCMKGKSEGTWVVMIGDTEYYTKQNCNNLIGQTVNCSHWQSEYKGKSYNWCKDVKATGGAEQPKTQSGVASTPHNEDERIRTMVLAYAKDLAVAGKIDVTSITAIAEDFFGYVKSWDKKSESDPF